VVATKQLADRPNLEQYSKQAKDLVKRRRAGNPSSTFTLAEAQFMIAREHGFDSWPKFAQHINGRPPLAGSWLASIAKSKRHPANPFRSATLHVDVDGNTVTFADVVVDEHGREARSTYTVQADGSERDIGNGCVLVARWVGPRVLETIAQKDGAVVARGRYEVSPDGRTLTVGDATGDQVLVLDRA
jgi:hypothetical protein